MEAFLFDHTKFLHFIQKTRTPLSPVQKRVGVRVWEQKIWDLKRADYNWSSEAVSAPACGLCNSEGYFRPKSNFNPLPPPFPQEKVLEAT